MTQLKEDKKNPKKTTTSKKNPWKKTYQPWDTTTMPHNQYSHVNYVNTYMWLLIFGIQISPAI